MMGDAVREKGSKRKFPTIPPPSLQSPPPPLSTSPTLPSPLSVMFLHPLQPFSIQCNLILSVVFFLPPVSIVSLLRPPPPPPISLLCCFLCPQLRHHLIQDVEGREG
jgi:hypothetical protein